MFLIDRPTMSAGLRADLAPAQLFGSAGDLIRAALVARPPVTNPAAPLARRPAVVQKDDAFVGSVRRRKVG
jgi:hypothetical protein